MPVLVGTFGCHVLSLSAEFKYSPSQCGKGTGIKRKLWLNLGGKNYVRKVVKVLNLEERKPQLLVF